MLILIMEVKDKSDDLSRELEDIENVDILELKNIKNSEMVLVAG